MVVSPQLRSFVTEKSLPLLYVVCWSINLSDHKIVVVCAKGSQNYDIRQDWEGYGINGQ